MRHENFTPIAATTDVSEPIRIFRGIVIAVGISAMFWMVLIGVAVLF